MSKNDTLCQQNRNRVDTDVYKLDINYAVDRLLKEM